MHKISPFRRLLVLAVVLGSVALAPAPKPATAFILLCSPPTIYVCVNKSCECSRYTCSRCGVKSFTCDENTGASTCVCKTC
ncbi:MAG TPA: hypothetical protein VGH73_09800 [Thermoanaerobaculia bacterium]|jgi:hypothetical protein